MRTGTRVKWLPMMAAVLFAQALPPLAGDTRAGIVDLCQSTVSYSGGKLFACPSLLGSSPNGGGPVGDFGDAGVTLTVTVRDAIGFPIAAIPATDFWVIGCHDSLVLCGGSGSLDADGPTDASGKTTISGQLRAGGCDTKLMVVVQGVILADPSDCFVPLCIDIGVVTPDSDGDLDVDLGDFYNFSAAYPSFDGNGNPVKGYLGVGECFDYDFNGKVDLGDLYHYSVHHFHACN